MTEERDDETREPPAAGNAPDATEVNAAWAAEATPPRGLRGALYRLLDRLLQPRFEAQRTFNAHQVRLDNELLRHLEERSAATHRHYDRLLGDLGRRVEEADERHVKLERELVTHVQDLVRRVDLVLAESGRGRVGLEYEIEELRERLARLEASLRTPG